MTSAAEVSDQGVLDKMRDAIAEPSSPGVLSRRFGEHNPAQMPDVFVDDEGELPEEASLELVRPAIFPKLGDAELSARLRVTRPRIFSALSDAELQARLRDPVAKLVKRARDDMELRQLPFLGRNALLRQSFNAVPKTPAPPRNPSPRIAAKSTPAQVEAIRRMLQLVREYRAAWLEWRSGDRAAVSPLGTYALRIYARIGCTQAVPA